MAQRSSNKKPDTKKLIAEDEVKAKPAVSDTALLQLQLATIYKANGEITGKEYVWPGAGSIQPVDRSDAEILLVKAVRRGCCGAGNLIKPVFVEV